MFSVSADGGSVFRIVSAFRIIDPPDKETPSGRLDLRAIACGCRDGWHGLRIAAGGKDFPLGFAPIAAVGRGRIVEGDFYLGISFGDLVGSLLGMIYANKL